MGLMHTLSPIVAIGVAYLGAHMVHSAFGWLNDHKDFVQRMENTTILSSIYSHTGLKAWVEQDQKKAVEADKIDPFEEPELQPAPENKVQHVDLLSTLREMKEKMLAA